MKAVASSSLSLSITALCECGQPVQVNERWAGKTYPCPTCGAEIQIRSATNQPATIQNVPCPSMRSAEGELPSVSKSARGRPGRAATGLAWHGVKELLIRTLLGWTAVLAASLILLLIVPPLGLLLLLGVLALGGYLGHAGFKLFLATSDVLEKKEVSLHRGLIKLVSWDPTEGVVFLKNKAIDYIDDDLMDGGGVRLIYPIFGQELALRVPLEIQTLDFHDANVLTREYVPLTIKGTIYWRVVDLERFYLFVSREIHTASDRGNHVVVGLGRHAKLEAAEQWLKFMAEEQTRSVISEVSTGLLVARQIATALPTEVQKQLSSGSEDRLSGERRSGANYDSATEGLSARLFDVIGPRVKQYGIDIHRVALQEVVLPTEIHNAAVEACRSAYLPLIAEREGMARKIGLQAEADVIGAEALAMKEVAGVAPPITVADFLTQWFASQRRAHPPK